MIDIEEDVVKAIAPLLREKYKKIGIYDEDIIRPSVFPCVSIVEIDNTCLMSARDSGSNEDYVEVTYEVNIYSNKTEGAKVESKDILKIIDNKFITLGFTRRSKTTMNFNDSTIYRTIIRYSAVVSPDGMIYNI